MPPSEPAAPRVAIEVRGARENNLQNVSVDIPRDKLVVVTGVSGSGKSSLAFETVYAEGQRRLLASMSSYAKRFVSQLKKPDVDFVNGLSPVVSIDQKTVGRNPRSTVGTMTDIQDYLRMLYASLGQAHCPWCEAAIPAMTPHRMAEHILALPAGTEVEVRVPVWKVWGEDWNWLLDQIRRHGYRRARVDGDLVDLGSAFRLDDEGDHRIEAVADTFVVEPGIEREIVASLNDARELGDGLLSFHIVGSVEAAHRQRFEADFGCDAHRIVSLDLHHGEFTFNDPAGACPTCGGLGTGKRVHKQLLVPDPTRSLRDGAIVSREYNPGNWTGRILYTLSRRHDFSLDTPFGELPEAIVQLLYYGRAEAPLVIEVPPEAKVGQHYAGREMAFHGFINDIERHYHWYRKQGEANTWTEDFLDKIMVEYDCPDCKGGRLKRTRELVAVNGKSLPAICRMHFGELLTFLQEVDAPPDKQEVASVLLREVTGRLALLTEIGLDYLSLDRRAGTLSGGESQRIRLSTQIGSGLMGMLYVLDEPSIGLHPKDNARMIATIRKLVDIGNTVLVVEHDEDTIRAADYCIEIGPGPGVHGGQVVATGTPDALMANEASLTGAYLTGRRSIALPKKRRTPKRWVAVFGCRHNNLQNVDLAVPLGVFTCLTGASGSGKSSFLHETLYKRLIAELQDSRVLPGDHDRIEGHEAISGVIHIDQSPIGRSSRSNPATYIGIYDHIRKLFATVDKAKKRGYTASRFSFNVKGGRCEQCAGEGSITTKLSFMPDVEVQCPTCKGARYDAHTLEILWNGKSIADVLDMSIEDGVAFFAGQKAIARKLEVLNDLGLGYLKIGHPAPILSGGEAQRVKLAGELSKMKRGQHLLYILDEPTTGLHFADIDRLLDSLNRLVDAGHSVVVIEHNLEVIKTADWIIDMGPEGGHKGGQVLATGRPEDVAGVEASQTGRFLKPLLR
ncbi:MAG: excinuclease ABC subunit UvrA [Rhodothermales bacterium]